MALVVLLQGPFAGPESFVFKKMDQRLGDMNEQLACRFTKLMHNLRSSIHFQRWKRRIVTATRNSWFGQCLAPKLCTDVKSELRVSLGVDCTHSIPTHLQRLAKFIKVNNMYCACGPGPRNLYALSCTVDVVCNLWDLSNCMQITQLAPVNKQLQSFHQPGITPFASHNLNQSILPCLKW